MKLVKLLGKRKIELIDAPIPKPNEGEVLIRTTVTAICGSEMEQFLASKAMAGNNGHEIVGVIEDPNGSTRYKKGERVGIANIQGCGECYWCRQGKQICCRKAIGISNAHAQYIKSNERWLHPLPDDISDGVGVMLTADGFGVPYGAITKCELKPGDICCVYGVGPVGQGIVLYLAYLGVKSIAMDINPLALQKAERLGAWRTVNSKEKSDVNKEIMELTDGLGPKVSFDCCGVQEVFNGALETTMPGGMVMTVAHGSHGIESVRESLSFHVGADGSLWARNLNVCGNWVCNFSDFQDMLSIVRKGFEIDKLIATRYSYTHSQKAYTQFEINRGKTLLLWEDEK